MEDAPAADPGRSDAFKRVNRVLLALTLLSAGWSLYGTTVALDLHIWLKFRVGGY